MKRVSILTHMAAAIIVTGILLAMYATVQQVHRTGANDPQLQLAHDISARVNSNNIDHLLPDDTIDISSSLGTFVTFYNSNGEPIGSTGMLDGKLPQIPKGVFEHAKANGENDITWQPRKGVRMAMVVESVPSSSQVSYVAVGRSLKEVEVRESNLVTMILMVWVACMAVILMHYLIQLWFAKKVVK
ncbi:hypothetical protein FRZ67_10120 [Panacibacter ginsenosidivorans]|uniref:Uncharacterized protein n=1 Tax=Panacibacter ginsenosidivorans TaxID=1813871 RepID=A0A5B8VBF2_9BACT|nr:hypothetical protein [Panacibacter ginsenosidivorans]QEC67628.1 hypothetical protein FRZ67_10120 [Panacibacter ginsenosidivorans]